MFEWVDLAILKLGFEWWGVDTMAEAITAWHRKCSGDPGWLKGIAELILSHRGEDSVPDLLPTGGPVRSSYSLMALPYWWTLARQKAHELRARYIDED